MFQNRSAACLAGLLLLLSCCNPMAALAQKRAAVEPEGRPGAWRKSSQGAPDPAKCKARVEKNPRDAVALNDLGFALRQAGDLEQAEKYLKQAIELKPDLAQAHSNLSVVYFDQKRYDDAVAEAMAAVKANAEHPVFRVVEFLSNVVF